VFSSIGRSWELAKGSFRVLRADIVAVILLVAVFALIASALSGIFTASIYRYATKGDGGPMYNNQTLATAFRQKR
jgi:hypothetical protein